MSNLPIKKRLPKLSKLSKSIHYGDDYLNYIPSTEALQYVNLNKLIYGEMDNATPVAHYQMFDEFYSDKDSCIVAARGMAKSTFVQNLFFYVAIFGELPTVGVVDFMIYVSDTVENGVRTMTEAMRYTYENSDFLQEYLPNCKFNETRWFMQNADGKSLVVRCYGAEAGIRGAREKNKRPSVAVIDDVLNDKNAVSPAKLRNIRNTVFKAIKFALDPNNKKMLLLGTPFHDKCIVSQAVQSGNFSNLILPICEKFPCTREEFKGAWEDRFSYDAVMDMYSDAENNSEFLDGEDDEDEEEGGMTLEGFYQEMMLQVDGDKLRIIDTSKHFRRIYQGDILANREAYNFYITTDFATKDNEQGDLSFMLVWAYDDNHNLYIIDGACGHNLMTHNIDQLFEFVEKYRPLEVGVETSGQQSGFVSWLEREMIQRDEFFTIIGNSPTINKLTRFLVVVPKIQAKKMWFTNEAKGLEWRVELEEELNGVTKRGFSCFTGETLIQTPGGSKRIDTIKKGDIVYGFDGKNKVKTMVTFSIMSGFSDKLVEVTLDDGNKVVCTPEHRWLTSDGYIKAIDLTLEHILIGDKLCINKLRDLEEYGLKKIQDIIKQQQDQEVKRNGFIERFGNKLMVKYQKVITYIIKMEIRIIIKITTWNCYLQVNTQENIEKNQEVESQRFYSMKKLGKKLLIWLDWLKKENIQERGKEERLKIETEYVMSVEKNLSSNKQIETTQDFVQKNAILNIMQKENMIKDSKSRSVSFANKNLNNYLIIKDIVVILVKASHLLFNILKYVKNAIKSSYQEATIQNTVVMNVSQKKKHKINAVSAMKHFIQKIKVDIVQANVKQRHIESVRKINRNANVYDITVPLTNNFYLDSGVVVHNSEFDDGCDCLIKGTQILLEDGSTKSIENISSGDMVMSFGGSLSGSKAMDCIITGTKFVSDYLFSNGEVITMTDNHLVLTMDGYKFAYELSNNDNIIKVNTCNQLNITTLSSQKEKTDITGQQLRLMEKEEVFTHTNTMKSTTFGVIMRTMYTILTSTKRTMIYLISKWLDHQSIQNCIQVIKRIGVTQKNVKNTWSESDHYQKNGIEVKKEKNGIRNTMKIIKINFIENMRKHVSNVTKNIQQSNINRNTVQENVNINTEKTLEKKLNVKYVVSNLKHSMMATALHVLTSVEKYLNMKIEKKELSLVNIVENNSIQYRKQRDSVQEPVTIDIKKDYQENGSARTKNVNQSSITKKVCMKNKLVQKNVNLQLDEKIEEKAKEHKGEIVNLVSVTNRRKEVTYNFEVEETNNYCTSTGIVLHNCVGQIQFLTLSRPYYETVIGDDQEDIDRVISNKNRVFNHNNDIMFQDKIKHNSYTV